MMKQHQVFTGSANPGYHCHSVGQISDFSFWAYGSGCDLVISSYNHQPIQIISCENHELISSLDCCDSNGKIAIAYNRKVVVYGPVIDSDNSVKCYKWLRESEFEVPRCEGKVSILSWSFDGCQLLVSCETISLWEYTNATSAGFEIAETVPDSPTKHDWNCVWDSRLKEEIIQLIFSPVSSNLIFASISKDECMIKVWYEQTCKVQNKFGRQCSEKTGSHKHDLTFTYLQHPHPVVSFEWRKGLFLEGKERFSNVLISTCQDQICRIWCESKQPISHSLVFHMLPDLPEPKQMQHGVHEASEGPRKNRSHAVLNRKPVEPVQLHKSPMLLSDARHFHICATINPLSDIPLLPSFAHNLRSGDGFGTSVFTVHFLNNKFYESRLQRNELAIEQANLNPNSTGTVSVDKDVAELLESTEVLDESMLSSTGEGEYNMVTENDKPASTAAAKQIICSWQKSRDVLFSIHPADGSLLVWHVEWLDDDIHGQFRQPQVCFSSRIPLAFPGGDASTLCPRVYLFVNHSTKQNLLYSASCMSLQANVDQAITQRDNSVFCDFQLLTKHDDGSLNLWQVDFNENANFSLISSITHLLRCCGHCFHISDILSHPLLPLVLTTASHLSNHDEPSSNNMSELILWRADPVGPLTNSGGLFELARVNCTDYKFERVAWFPVLFPTWCLGHHNTSPSTSLISLEENKLHIFQVVVDASQLLQEMLEPGACEQSENRSYLNLISKQSSSHPGCLLHLSSTKDEDRHWGNILFVQAYPDVITTKHCHHSHEKLYENHFFVMMVDELHGKVNIHTWKVTFYAALSTVRPMRKRRTTLQVSDSSDVESDQPELADHSTTLLTYMDTKVTKLSTQLLNLGCSSQVMDVCSGAGQYGLTFLLEQESFLDLVPFHLCIACDNGKLYFWTCVSEKSVDGKEICHWTNWKPSSFNQQNGSYSLNISGRPLVLKCANPLLLACVYVQTGDVSLQFRVAVYESASSGGSFWTEQDNFRITSSVSFIEDIDNSALHLEWLSQEEGSYLLAVGFGADVHIYSLAPRDLSLDGDTTSKNALSKTLLRQHSSLDVHTRQKLKTAGKQFEIVKRSVESSSDPGNAIQPLTNHLLGWKKVMLVSVGRARGDVNNGVGGHSSSVKVSWACGGILVAGTPTEMYAFCHWNAAKGTNDVETYTDASSFSLFEVADNFSRSLPQYHPLVLSELLNSGHLDTVRNILINLALCFNRRINGDLDNMVSNMSSTAMDKFRLSDCCGNMTEFGGLTDHITPLSLYLLLGENGKVAGPKISKGKDDGVEVSTSVNEQVIDIAAELKFSESDTADSDEELNEILGKTKSKKSNMKSKNKVDLNKLECGKFGNEHCNVIHSYLVHHHLSGLSSLDQMELMALADTLNLMGESTFNTDANDESQGYKPKTMGFSAGGGYAVSAGGTSSLDSCGLRFVMALHNHLCLQKSLPVANRARLVKQGLDAYNFAWAFHSEAEEEILFTLPSVQRGSPEWLELKSFGAGWWIRSKVLLRKLIEQAARAAFLKRNEPLDAALFYLTLNKKAVLCGLFKTVKDTRMHKFFQNNFSEERWHRAALNNAFALMGKQRFHEAAAFFLLAGSINDAIEVCIGKLGDLQLAMTIARLSGTTDALYHKILQEHVLCPDESRLQSFNQYHKNCFIRSMAFWITGQYEKSVSTLLDEISYEDITDIFNFYFFLRLHPIIVKHQNMQAMACNLRDFCEVEKKIEKERNLIFQTAVVHLEAGCSMLALDSLSKLKIVTNMPNNATSVEENIDIETINTRNVLEVTPRKVDDLDWSQPVDLESEDLQLDWSEEDDELSDNAEQPRIDVVIKTPANSSHAIQESAPKQVDTLDVCHSNSSIFINHLRMSACWKIFVQELRALTSAYSANGGQLRHELYGWLDKTSAMLHRIFGSNDSTCDAIGDKLNATIPLLKPGDSSSDNEETGTEGVGMSFDPEANSIPSLHEVIIADSQDWRTRRKMLKSRRKWLQRNHYFLHSLLSYCTLHDTTQSFLATLRIELMLLLQESLQHQSYTRQLAAPLPSPSGNIPLIISAIRCSKTVTADPFSNLNRTTIDILRTILRCDDILSLQNELNNGVHTSLLCSEASSLSSCIYQILCDTKCTNADSPDTDLCCSEDSPNHGQTIILPTTQPSQWPGVSLVHSLHHSDVSEMTVSESRMKIVILLCEIVAAVFVALLIHGLSTNNHAILYRLANHALGPKMWNAVFGGGVRQEIKHSTNMLTKTSTVSGSPHDIHTIRGRLNNKILKSADVKRSPSCSIYESSSYKESFVHPYISMWDWFLTKPFQPSDGSGSFEFDSDADQDDDDPYSVSSVYSFDDDTGTEGNSKTNDNCDPNSYASMMTKLAVVQTALTNMNCLVAMIGFDVSELSSTSSLLSAVLRLLDTWRMQLTKQLDKCHGPPSDFLPFMTLDTSVANNATQSPRRPAMLKYQVMLEPNNTPFEGRGGNFQSGKRLWLSLVKKESLQPLFIKYIFERKSDATCDGLDEQLSQGDFTSDADESHSLHKVKILHKDTELIAGFCINNVNANCVSTASAKEIQEIDLTNMLASNMWMWVDDSSFTEKDGAANDDDFLVVPAPPGRQHRSSSAISAAHSPALWSSTALTGQGGNVLIKRPISGVKRLDSHPTLPYYVVGTRDGGISMWEWGHQHQIAQYQQPGQHAKVCNVHFSALGNKFAAVDHDGYLSLWQVGTSQRPYFYYLCHNRGTSDCCFVSSTSVLATTGMSSTHKNVAVWDTLMPKKRMLVKDFIVHENTGASCVKYLSRHHKLIVGSKNGQITVFDDRCLHGPMYRHSSHDGAIKCIAADPQERFYVTGSSAGDVKVWDAQTYKLLHESAGEHARSSLFRNFGSGTMQIHVTDGSIFSCGADGSLKMQSVQSLNLFA